MDLHPKAWDRGGEVMTVARDTDKIREVVAFRFTSKGAQHRGEVVAVGF